jgi:aerobic carbon-monoxide dehydrogenase medium subunit
MKASAFSYARATSVVNALELLAAYGDRAKLLSGGQSLMPAMNLRLLAPELIIDIGQLNELRGIAVNGDVVRIGALTRHVEIERSTQLVSLTPLLTQAIAQIAHPAIRNRGTIGGSLAQADPASELPACMVALNATIIVTGPKGERRIAATDFFKGIYQTELSADEILIAVELRPAPKNAVHYFHEFARRQGDYAIAGLAAGAIRRGERFGDLRMAFFAVGDRPVLARAAQALIGVAITPAVLTDAAAALGQELDPQDDQQGSAAMRKHLAKVLMARGVAALLGRPDLGSGGHA